MKNRHLETHPTGVRAHERGANLVEMAVLIPFLLIMFVGIVDFGGAFNRHIGITNAAREGARYGAKFPFDESGIITATIQEASGYGVTLTSSNIAINPDPGGTPAGSGDPLTVTVVYTYPTMLGGYIGLQNIPLRTATVMRVFGID